MKFRYFTLKGESLKVYLESEELEMTQRDNQHDALMEKRDDIDSYRPTRNGGILSVKFKVGKQPAGFVRADNRLPSDEVRPHGKRKDLKEWRAFLSSIAVTENCQNTIQAAINLPQMVIGGSSNTGWGHKTYGSRVGHVGDSVYVEVPETVERQYEPHQDLEEMRGLEFEKSIEEAVAAKKAKEDAGDDSCTRGYIMTSRMEE